MRNRVTFLLNGEVVSLNDIPPTLSVLNFLRHRQRLTGSKEGCAEGDCGACTVVVGELHGDGIRYRALNSCILFVPLLDGRALITVEALREADGARRLHPVQQALVDKHGSQCGFCTPGFVMSLYAVWLNTTLQVRARPTRDQLAELLAGNLCRCTGYGPILEAGEAMFAMDPPGWDEAARSEELLRLKDLQHDDMIELAHEQADGQMQRYFAPARLDDLARLVEAHRDAVLLAGATDVALWVTKQHRVLPTIIDLGRVHELQKVSEQDGRLRIGAGVTYADALGVITRQWPDFGALVRRIGAEQVRGSGTIGGNIANGSPIGDTPPVLIALDATLVLRRGESQRRLALEDFFIRYGVQDLREGEFVEAIEIPLGDNGRQLRCYKISKRFDQDISALLGCFNIDVDDGVVTCARIAFGGMAEIPKRARHVEQALAGKSWTRATVAQVQAEFDKDFTPLSDLRASADYRMTVAKNLLERYFIETTQVAPAVRLDAAGFATQVTP